MNKKPTWLAPALSAGILMLLLGLGALLYVQWQAVDMPGVGKTAAGVARTWTLAVAPGAMESFRSVTWKGRTSGAPEEQAAVLAAAVGRAALEGAEPLWPAPINVRNAYLREAGLLILDLEGSISYNHGHDAVREWRLLRSLTMTLINSLEGVKQVKFLVNGAETETLAGHMGIARPFGVEDVTP